MNRTLIRELKNGQTVKIQGFVENCRNKRTMAFIVIRDISGKIQVTLEKEIHPELAAVVDQLSTDCVVSVIGKVAENSFVKLNGVEIIPESIIIESKAEALPLQPDATIDTRMDYRWVDLRSERNQLIFKVQTLIMNELRNYLLEKDFLEIHSPKLIGAASESGADVFELDYFDRKAYLAQSPQFYKQMAMAAGFEKIFECGPVFRAEKSYTSKHTTEFTGFDLEISYIESYRDIMKLEEEMLTRMIRAVNSKYGNDIKRLFGTEIAVPTLPFPVMKLSDVYCELEKRYGYTVADSEKGDLTTDAEHLCQKLTLDMFDHEFLFITEYSAEKRAFYHMRDENGTPLGYDLIWKGVEITTGAQREHRYDVLKAQADEKGLGEDVKHYLQFFKYGCPPHGGFGMGLDRITMMLLDITIKEVMFLFRSPNRLVP